MFISETLLRGFVEYERDKLTRESLEKIFRHYAFDQSKFYVCSEQGEVVNMVNETGKPSLTIDYLGSDPDRFAKLYPEKEFYLYSFYLTLVEYFACNMNFKINFVFNFDDFNSHETFIMDPIPLEKYTAENGLILLYNVIYELEILTTNRMIKSNDYFGFIRLFDWIFWSCLLISMVLMALLWKVSSFSRMSFTRGLTDIWRTITTQSSNSGPYWRRLRNGKNSLTLLFSMYLWFFVSNIITKWLSGVLLDSYLPSRKVPFINGVDDLINNPGLMITGGSLVANMLDEEDEEIDPAVRDKFEKFRKMRQDLNIKSNTRKIILENTTMINEIAEGKRVMFCSSADCRMFRNLYRDKDLIVAKDKYDRNFNLYWVNKNVEKATTIIKVLKRFIELGFDKHARFVERLKTRIRSRIIRKLEISEANISEIFKMYHDKDVENELNNRDKTIQPSHLDDEQEQSKYDDQGENAITLRDALRGVFLDLLMGIIQSSFVFTLELCVFYYKSIAVTENRINSKRVKLESMRFEANGFDTIVVSFHKKKDLRNKFQRNKVHRVLRANYEIYFS